MSNNRNWIPGISFIIGMAVFATLAGHTLRAVKRMEEFVAVKGLSEREVPADLGIWPVTFSVGESDLSNLQGQIQTARETVYQFLAESGFEQTEISNAPPQITDWQAGTVFNRSRFPNNRTREEPAQPPPQARTRLR